VPANLPKGPLTEVEAVEAMEERIAAKVSLVKAKVEIIVKVIPKPASQVDPL
jgi:hypothetical protein